MSLPSRIAIQLHFSTQIKAQLIALSRAVGKISPSTFTLGPQLPPHITLFGFVPEDTPPRLPPKMISVRFAGSGQLGAEKGRIWLSVMVEKTEGLVLLREKLIAACGRPKLIRADFTPHVTLANVAAGDFDKISAAIGNVPLLKAAVVPCKTVQAQFA